MGGIVGEGKCPTQNGRGIVRGECPGNCPTPLSGGFSYSPGGADPRIPHESRHVRPYGLPKRNLVLFLLQIENAMLMAFQPARSMFNSAFLVDPIAVLYQP